MKKVRFVNVLAIIIVIVTVVNVFLKGTKGVFKELASKNDFNMIINPDNKDVEEDLTKFAKKNGIDLHITYMDDLEAVDKIDEDVEAYDAVWLSNSIWSYKLNNVSLSESSSININPVVFGVKKSKAKELGFVDKEIYNNDIINAIKNGKLKYVMTSVTKTNNGVIAYLGFLNSLAGSPEILTSDMLNDKELESQLVTLFSGVERVSGSSTFLEDMFLNSDEYEAVVASESSLIRINKQLENENKETLYLLYPKDGVAVNDSPFAYIDNSKDNKDDFLLIKEFLLSQEEQNELEKMGKRTWYGGIKANADKNSFKTSWGIDTSKYLNATKYPSSSVIDDALLFYINALRKPASVAFCLDFSGSMSGEYGEYDLKEAMDFILDETKAGEELIQFSDKDKIYVLPFSTDVINTFTAFSSSEMVELISDINNQSTGGSTNLYGCAEKALSLVGQDSDDYTKTVILMTDGASNVGTYSSLSNKYNSYYKGIPIYSIMFGQADEDELEDIAELSNGKVFDGRSELISAFKEVRSYN